MQLELWEFRVKSNKMPRLPSPIHPAAREDAAPAEPSPEHRTDLAGSAEPPAPSPALEEGLGPVLDALGTWNQGTEPAGPPARGSPLLRGSAEPAHLLLHCIVITAVALHRGSLPVLCHLRSSPPHKM